MKLLRSALTSSIFLKASSLILGFLMWTTINDLFTHTKWVTIPLCFYNGESLKIIAPESITLELTGKRAHLKQIAYGTLAAHIDAQSLTKGDNLLTITRDHLLMPPSITVATTVPQSIVITVQSGEQ